MKELQRRLLHVVKSRFNGSAREASKAARLGVNRVGQILDDEHSVPSLPTLARLAEAYDWPLGEVAYWALDRVPPYAESGSDEPLAVIAVQLTRLGLDEGMRQSLLEIIRGVSGPARDSESSSAAS